MTVAANKVKPYKNITRDVNGMRTIEYADGSLAREVKKGDNVPTHVVVHHEPEGDKEGRVQAAFDDGSLIVEAWGSFHHVLAHEGKGKPKHRTFSLKSGKAAPASKTTA